MARRPVVPSRGDLLLAVCSAFAVTVDVALNEDIEQGGVALASGLVAALALAWRRRHPLPVALVAAAGMAASSLLGVPLEAPIAPLLIVVAATYSVAAAAPLPVAATGLGALLAADAIAVAAQDKGIGNFVFGLVWISFAWAVGRAARSRSAEARHLEARAAAAAADERVRIARELHDVISHSVTAMVVQAGAAEEVMRRHPERALAAMQIVQSTGRQAIAELARLLGVMREGSVALGHAPMPGIDDVEELVATTGRTGQPVELEVRGRRRPLPQGLELSVFRMVQEALTNARKHAAGARTRVLLEYQDAAVIVEVIDDGGAAAGSGNGAGPGGGHGLIGMRERVALYGGTLEVARRAEGGFGVRARLPLEPAP